MKQSLFVISDLHLGGSPAGDGKPSFQMCSLAGRARLAEFIHYVTNEGSADRKVHLVLNGDIVDFLAEEEFTPFTAQDDLAGQKLTNIFQRTEDVWKSLEAFVRSGSKLTLLLGNIGCNPLRGKHGFRPMRGHDGLKRLMAACGEEGLRSSRRRDKCSK